MTTRSAIAAAAIRYVAGKTDRELPAELAELTEEERERVIHAAARAVAATNLMAPRQTRGAELPK